MWYLVCIIIKKYFLCSEVWWLLQWPSRLLLLQGRRSNSPGCLGCTGPPWPRIIVVIVIVIIIVDMVPQTWSQTNSITIVKHNHFQTPPSLPYNLSCTPVPPMMPWCHKHITPAPRPLILSNTIVFKHHHTTKNHTHNTTCLAPLCLLWCQRWCHPP